MTIRFLQTCPSETPDFPFTAGQEIHVSAPSSFLLSLVDGIRAIAVRTDETERAVAVAADIPEPTPKRRGRRARA